MTQGEWNNRLTGEPPLTELLADPCTHAVMRRDDVDMICLLNMIAVARLRLTQRPTSLAA